jgi:hypothetical protein
MTDERLIEEAAEAIYNDDPAWGYVYEDDRGEHAAPWEHLGDDLHDKFRSLAGGVLAVFEKAHTPNVHRFEGESEPVASNPVLRGVDLALERLVRRDCFTERTMRVIDELRAEVLAASEVGGEGR